MRNSRIYSDLQYTELELEVEIPYVEDYQVRMIGENAVPHLLKMVVSGKDEGSLYSYDISGMKSLHEVGLKEEFSKAYIEKFMEQLGRTILSLTNYMLNRNCLLMEPEYIFEKEGVFYFCYFPPEEEPIGERFHRLTEFFVKGIDYSDYPSVVLACGLHKETMNPQYDLTTLMEAQPMEHIRDYNYERETLQREESLWTEQLDDGYVEYESMEEEEVMVRISTLQKMKNVMRETPVHRYLNQRKKDKWGTWDDLLTQEESSIMEQG